MADAATPPPADRVATELAAIRERARDITDEHGPDDCDLNGDTCTGHDAERLLGAIEAALELHVPIPDGQDWCKECGHSFPCWTRRKISAELTGEESPS